MVNWLPCTDFITDFFRQPLRAVDLCQRIRNTIAGHARNKSVQMNCTIFMHFRYKKILEIGTISWTVLAFSTPAFCKLLNNILQTIRSITVLPVLGWQCNCDEKLPRIARSQFPYKAHRTADRCADRLCRAFFFRTLIRQSPARWNIKIVNSVCIDTRRNADGAITYFRCVTQSI